MHQPNVCRPEAFHLFAEQMPRVESTGGLVAAAVAISMHELEGVDLAAVRQRIDRLAARVRARVRSDNVQALLAHLHDVLFDEGGFTGNVDDYYNSLNSYIPAVLETRRGIPITLTLLYKAVAEPLGLEVEGINAPGHFMGRVKSDDGSMLVDPFSEGRLLSQEDAFQRIEEIIGREVPRTPRLLPRATHRQWLARILANLRPIFARAKRHDDVAAMTELGTLLGPVPF
jgi:regulator of sirC expression with transglutaminase-like and TPR domain